MISMSQHYLGVGWVRDCVGNGLDVLVGCLRI